MKHSKITAAAVARVGVMGAIAAILYYVPEIPVIPPIYKLDFSTLPALLCSFAMGPVSGLAVLLIKDLTGLLHSSSMGVGELADFLTSGAFIVVASLMYRREKTRKNAVAGMLCGLIAMVIVGALANYYIMIPFYVNAMGMPLESIVSMIAKTIPAVDSLVKLILLATVPFNLLKGAVLCVITFALYKRVSPLLHAQ